MNCKDYKCQLLSTHLLKSLYFSQDVVGYIFEFLRMDHLQAINCTCHIVSKYFE